MILYDTNVVILLRDSDRDISTWMRAQVSAPAISLITRIELEGGVYAKPDLIDIRRAALADVLVDFTVLPINEEVVSCYGRILATCGFSRPRLLDRLIAATAIVHGLTLVTINAADFRDIPGLTLEAWPAPTQ